MEIVPGLKCNLYCDRQVESSLQRVHAFVLELQAPKVSELRRGPYLAELEIEKRRLLLISDAGAADVSSAGLAQAILKYYQRFSLIKTGLSSGSEQPSILVLVLS